MVRGDRKRVALPGDADRSVATVSVSDPQPATYVADERALLAHVKATWPEGSVEVVEKVRESVVSAVLAAPWTPEGDLVPGVDTRAGSPVLSVSQTAQQAQVLLDAWRAGEELPVPMLDRFAYALGVAEDGS